MTDQKGQSCCCGSSSPAQGKIPEWVSGFLPVDGKQVPIVRTTLTRSDIFGSWRARWDIDRMNYKVSPGLYAVGQPDATSPVLVSANYKLSFDMLRKELGGLNAWILVIDTKGINVWCAAGKGTFSAEEIAKRIYQTGLLRIISHKTLILPQLAAPGVVAHKLAQAGFKVVYGPVRASDIRAFLKAGMVATPEMRRVTFTIKERAVLTPVEIVHTFKPLLIIFAVLFIYNLITPEAVYTWDVFRTTVANFLPFLGAALIGSFFVPVLLPWIPGHAFAWKGWLLGAIWAAFVSKFAGFFGMPELDWEWLLANFLLLPTISAYLAMNFTGTSTYTSPSGVEKEMRLALPVQMGTVALGVIAIIVSKVFALIS